MNHFRAYEECRLCPRDCKVNRLRGERGVCGETAILRIAHLGAHFGEEPSFTGARGSGTIFFSGCSSRCFFCQNYQISFQHKGDAFTPEAFLARVKNLIQKSSSPAAGRGDPVDEVHNINFVSPDHFWPHVRDLCRSLQEEGIRIPKIFNGSGYQKPELIESYGEWMDIFMPDFKFAETALAEKCMGDPRYPEIAFEALQKMVKLKGFLDPWDPTGEVTARRGVLVRHLVLPGFVENSLEVLRILHAEFGPDIPLSVMSQYQPVPACSGRAEFSRGLKAQEYEQVLKRVKQLGFTRVYVQELVEETSFLPDFHDPEDPFPGHRSAPG